MHTPEVLYEGGRGHK